jgi:hypothetical protein
VTERDPHDAERREHIGRVQDAFLEGLVAVLYEEKDAILEHLSRSELPPDTTRYVRHGSWGLIEAGANIERTRIDAKFAEMLVLIREQRIAHEGQLNMLRARVVELEARLGAA